MYKTHFTYFNACIVLFVKEAFRPERPDLLHRRANQKQNFTLRTSQHHEKIPFFFFLQENHYGLLTHPVIAAELRQHYNMARSMAALSLSFIILVTPWTMKEVAVSCTGTKVSLT